MTINGINGTNTQAAQMGMNQAMDSYSKNIQSQIANAQKQLQELSSNEEMTPEEKMKKRQEIQQQISDLNIQLRQHQIEQRKEKQQAKGSSMDEMLGGTNARRGGKGAGFSQASMTAILSADTSLKQAKAQGSVATGLKGRAGVLESEIQQDAGRGASVEKKKEELAEVKQKAQAATASQMNTLAEAGKAVEKAAEAERAEQKDSDEKEKKAAKAKDKTEGGAKGEKAKEDGSVSTQTGSKKSVQPDHNEQDAQPDQAAVPEAQAAQEAAYAHVDVRL